MSKGDTHISDAKAEVALEFIQRTIATRGYPPSRREIAEAVGSTSSSSGQVYIDILVRKGLIEVDPLIPRGIRIVSAKL